MFYTYILKSLKDRKRYIGFTSDIAKRLNYHNAGLNPSTKNRRPFDLFCFKKFKNKLEAERHERYLKRLKGGKQLEKEIEEMLKSSR
ncbi:MAG: hypothetical protein A2Y98_03780 [Candidatus Portnoybacteria bacterium RBG_19FT_COMBO_36_7]|uniref:GIY-YIG domain-containing protein n=1 Tax=Candidatus Portnoybacteria bacterium RBG_19FT_COMBO_36_7 TaxID=1801992 RepID=A0A1G2F8T3_9BACT|nr:MAG: hypothetical protein A2Y98_03780 [Candidatus Portnoybacteria bacterium RBG_19FT_COMBO_36_7]